MYGHETVGMVDISEKKDVLRKARATGSIRLKKSTIEAIKKGEVEKGDVFACAQIAAILSTKKTAEAIPMCHPISVTDIKVDFSVGESIIEASVEVKSIGKTGVEMEALHGVSVALLTIWDMVKSLEKDEHGNYPHTKIENVRVVEKIIYDAEEGI
ncbi:MAG: cyclic pyranopterin monophosphate synthase MoaC [Candidatus Syntropharchaeia archaeon]